MTQLEISVEAQGSLPNFRYDLIQPLVQGRIAIEGVTLRFSDARERAGFYENPKFKDGDFGLLDTNLGDVIAAIDAGWNLRCLPVFIKRKPSYSYLWVRADRGINAPKDLEGKTIATIYYGSAITTYNMGFLQHFYGVDISTIRWLTAPTSTTSSAGRASFPVHKPVHIEPAPADPPKTSAQRLLDGEADACTGDIIDADTWQALESNPGVKRLFPDYQLENKRLFTQRSILTPVHIVVMGSKLDDQNPALARKLYEAFESSREIAYVDALGDGSSYSMILHSRELVRDQLKDLGDVYKHGITANKNTIDAFLDYNFEQGLTRTRLSYEQVFARDTLDT